MKLVIVGGVAAGASAAARARRLDEKAEIIVFEKDEHVSFANCGLPYHIGGEIKERDCLLLNTPKGLKEKMNLDVRVFSEVIKIDGLQKKLQIKDVKNQKIYEETYDKLILCPGASPLKPNMPGHDLQEIFTLRNIQDMDNILAKINQNAKSAVVIGAGFIGLEMAENLHRKGLQVSIVEMSEQVMPPFDKEMASYLHTILKAYDINLHLGTKALSFEKKEGQVLVHLENKQILKTDFVILSIGVKPETSLAKEAQILLSDRGGIKVDEYMQTSVSDIYAAGDAVSVIDTVTNLPTQIPLAGPANRQGRIAANNIFGKKSTYKSTQGTAIFKLFEISAGCTGASERTLVRTKKSYEKIYIHPNNHAGYYPKSCSMHIKMLFDSSSGQILGAQIVGHEGVDKRLDLLALAIRQKMTVYDLEDLELAYAPPFGSAKDPINMAGFVGVNLLQKDVEFWNAEDFPQKTNQGIIVDVRDKDEFDIWHIPKAIHIPLDKLRESLSKISREKQIYLYCKVGIRSYLAYKILKQNNFDKISTLAGGSLTFLSFHESLSLSSQTKGSSMPKQTHKKFFELDCSGLQCPGPIRKLNETIQSLSPGDELLAKATDPGFITDVPAWCKKHGHTILDTKKDGPNIAVKIRKGFSTESNPIIAKSTLNKKTMVVFSGDLDKVLAAFVMANGAISMGNEVTLFFTFWGLNALRKSNGHANGKPFLDRLFGWMMPKGAKALKLSKMNMMGMGTAMMKYVMQKKNVDNLSDLMIQAQKSGVKMVACAMSMDVMGLTKEELIDGVEISGVASFLGEADESNMSLFI